VLLGLPQAVCGSLLQLSATLVATDGLVVQRALVERLATGLVQEVASFHAREPYDAGISVETLRHSLPVPDAVAAAALAAAERSGSLTIHDGLVARPAFRPAARVSEAVRERLVAAVRSGGLKAPSTMELADRLGIRDAESGLREAALAGEVFLVERGRYLSAEALQEFAQLLREVGSTGEITPGAVRDRSGLSRKYLIPLLEWADRTGITRREGEGRRLLAPLAGLPHGA
jgi:selenocysteine-specific elongation factor